MAADIQSFQIGADDFARRFSLRAANLMWFLGAGASASAGIPTAVNMVWDFKQRLFVSQRRVAPQIVADLSNAAVRNQIQAHIDTSGNLPKLGDPDEYAALFEEVFPAEIDRRSYLDSKMDGAKPSYGHLALATLMQGQLARLVWTTNFDPLLADACAKVYDATGPLTTVTLDAPELAEQTIAAERWPLEVKLHGDFRSRRLKNTNDELRHQDNRLRQVFTDTCRRFGLVVVGYSGRDDSIMDALEDPLSRSGAFPNGLFWLHRESDTILPRVERFLEQARDASVEVASVAVENFDEALRDLIRLIEGINTDALDAFATGRRRWSEAPKPSGKRSWPVVRLNAIPVTHAPSVCRLVDCKIGGYSDLRAAMDNAGNDILVARVRAGVLAFGGDTEVRETFEGHGIELFDLHTIEQRRLRYDSGERGLLRDALTRALTRNRNLVSFRRRNTDLLRPADESDAVWQPLKRQVKTLSGTVSENSNLQWFEGVGTRLDWIDGRLCLLIEPTTVFDGINSDNKAAAADFARERTVQRYNRQLNDLVAFWANYLAGDGSDLHALGISDGVDARFRLSAETAYSWRVVA